MKQWTETVTWTEITDDPATWPPCNVMVNAVLPSSDVVYGCRSGYSFSWAKWTIAVCSLRSWAPLPTGREPEPTPPRPEVVCLCGSTRFKDAFVDANRRETLAGRIVLSVGLFAHAGDTITDADKLRLDDLHKRKIDMADRVLVLNVGGYIGSSTRSEIEYAQRIGKPVEYLEPTQTEPTP